MANTKRKPTLSKAILNLVILIPTFFGILGKVITLVEFEAQLAGKSLIRLIALSVVFGTLLTATWICVLAMLYTYFQSLLWSPYFSLFILLLLNVLMLIVISFCLCQVKKNIFFPEIRNQIRYLQKLFKKS